MGLFFEVIVVGAITWLFGRSVLQSQRERRLARATTGLHDAGVPVDEHAWMRIIAQLQSDSGCYGPGDQGRSRDRLE